MSPVEVRAVGDCRLLGYCSAENFGFPGIQMRIKVDNCGWSIGAVDRSQQWEDNRVISTESDDPGMKFAVFSNAFGALWLISWLAMK